jgi:RHS repeat-associated protein
MAYAPFGEGYAGGISWVQFADAGDATVYDTENQSGSLVDFMFRRYNPTQGRWISPDPAGLAAVDPTNPQSWNRYAYVMNNPVSATDPLGLCGPGQNGGGYGDNCWNPNRVGPGGANCEVDGGAAGPCSLAFGSSQRGWPTLAHFARVGFGNAGGCDATLRVAA